MRRRHGGLLLPMLSLIVCLTLPYHVQALSPGAVLITEVMLNPSGTDTGQEYVTLKNTTDVPVDISGWDLDAGALPYLAFAQGTVIASQGSLKVLLRRDGVQTIDQYFTGASFGSTDMNNTKGSVALFSSQTRTSGTIVDFIQYGDVGQTHEASALTAGLWVQGTYLPTPEEGVPFLRSCLEQVSACFEKKGDISIDDAHETTDTSVSTDASDITEEANSTGSGTLLGEESGDLSSGTGSTLSIQETGSGSTLPTQIEIYPMVQNQPPLPKIRIQGKGVASGVVPFPLNLTGEDSTDDKGITNYLWDYGNGYTFQGKNPLEYKYQTPGMYTVTLTVIDTDGVPVSSTLLVEVMAKETPVVSTSNPPAEIISAEQPTVEDGANEDILQDQDTGVLSSTCMTGDLSYIRLSEILPNPDGVDRGQEWIELYNTSTEAICLLGLVIEEGVNKVQTYTLGGITLAAKSYLVLTDTVMNITIDNTLGRVLLKSKDGVEMDKTEYTNAPSGKSWTRTLFP